MASHADMLHLRRGFQVLPLEKLLERAPEVFNEFI